MNGFAALDIHTHRRYVVDIGGRRSSRCRLHINFALFLHSLDFTQNLGVTRRPIPITAIPLRPTFCSGTFPSTGLTRPGWEILPTFPPGKAGSIWPLSKTCVHARPSVTP